MKFHKWSDSDSDFSHEYEQIKYLIDAVKAWSEKNNTITHLLTNFYIGGEEIDALVIIPNNLIVIELKQGSGIIEGQENGDWLCKENNKIQFQINHGRKNPLSQARDKRWAVINYLEQRKEKIFFSQKSGQMKFEHTSSFIVFDGKISWDRKQLPQKYWPQFDVLSIDAFPDKINSIRSKVLSLTSKEAWSIPT